jgi:phage shock protein A
MSRFTNYIKTVMSSFLDRAEDPGQTLDYSYEKQLEQLQNLKRSIADVVTSEKRLELMEAQVNAQIQRYDNAARQALSMGKEDLARSALERKQGLQTQLTTYDPTTSRSSSSKRSSRSSSRCRIASPRVSSSSATRRRW